MTYKRKRCDRGECLRFDLEAENARLRAALSRLVGFHEEGQLPTSSAIDAAHSALAKISDR